MEHPITEYARRVAEGTEPAGLLHRAACQRHLDDLASSRYRFDHRKADHIIRFFGLLTHYKGEWAGQPISLEPFQQFIVGSLFGWIDPGTGFRRFRQCYLEQPRGQGKSTLAAGVALYLAFCDGEPGAEVYCAATHRQQAKITWEAARQMVLRSGLKGKIQTRVSNLHDTASASKLEPVGADADTLDGLRPNGVILDEIHAHKSSAMIDVMTTATGTRRQPLVFEITTAGVGRVGICWEHHEYSSKVVRRVIEDDTWFGLIIGADPEDDWTLPEVWRKANPNLGVSVKREDLERKCQQAKHMGAAEPEFRRLHLGQWVQQADRYLPMEQWDKTGNAADVDTEALIGQTCVIGLDISSKFDFTAVVALFNRSDGGVIVHPLFFLPEAAIDPSRKAALPLDAWRRAGRLEVTPGNVIDQDIIYQRIVELGQKFRVAEIAFDPWNATALAVRLQQAGFPVVEIRQGFKTLNEPTQQLAALVADGKLQHGKHPILRWMADNMVVRTDANGNVAPDKGRAMDKIDGMVALIMALSRRHHTQEAQYQMLVLGRR